MPDRDVFPGLHRAFRKAGRSVRAVGPAEVVGNLGEKGLADLIRTDPGGPVFVDAAAAISDSGDPGALRVIATPAELEASYLLRRLEETARRIVPCDETLLLVETFRGIVADQFQALRPELVADQGLSSAEASRYLNECGDNVRSEKLAESVSRNGVRVKAPPRRRKSTSDLLYERLD